MDKNIYNKEKYEGKILAYLTIFRVYVFWQERILSDFKELFTSETRNFRIIFSILRVKNTNLPLFASSLSCQFERMLFELGNLLGWNHETDLISTLHIFHSKLDEPAKLRMP